jgi:hypothetical protein
MAEKRVNLLNAWFEMAEIASDVHVVIRLTQHLTMPLHKEYYFFSGVAMFQLYYFKEEIFFRFI